MSSEAERVVLALVEIPFFGKEEHGVKLAESLAREMALQFGGARVKTWSQMEVSDAPRTS